MWTDCESESICLLRYNLTEYRYDRTWGLPTWYKDENSIVPHSFLLQSKRYIIHTLVKSLHCSWKMLYICYIFVSTFVSQCIHCLLNRYIYVGPVMDNIIISITIVIVVKDSQILPWWTTNWFHSINIWGIGTEVITSVFSVACTSIYEFNFTLLVLIPTVLLASVSTIPLPTVQAISRINKMVKLSKLGKSHASMMKLSSYCCVWNTAHHRIIVWQYLWYWCSEYFYISDNTILCTVCQPHYCTSVYLEMMLYRTSHLLDTS